MDRYQYAFACGTKKHMYILHYKTDETAETIEEKKSMDMLRGRKVCTCGMLKVMHIGEGRLKSVRNASRATGVVPVHRSMGKSSPKALSADDQRRKALKVNFNYLLQFGEVRATRVIATMVDGSTQGHTNRGE